MPVTGPTRELACAALRHPDMDEPRCPATDERLMRELTEEVQRLRQLIGAEPDQDAAVTALREAQGPSGGYAAWPAPEGVYRALVEDGWRLVRAPGA